MWRGVERGRRTFFPFTARQRLQRAVCAHKNIIMAMYDAVYGDAGRAATTTATTRPLDTQASVADVWEISVPCVVSWGLSGIGKMWVKCGDFEY